MAMIVYFVGAKNIENFLDSSKWLQPLFAAIVGLIPNCAPSTILAQLFVKNGLEFGALFTGLCVNAGIAYIALFRNNSRAKVLKIIATILITSIALGYVVLLF